MSVPEHRSYSQMNQLRLCGEQFRLERIERVPSRPSCAALAGTAVHTGTERADALLMAGSTDRLQIAADAGEAAISALDTEVEALAAQGWAPNDFKRYGKQGIEWFRSTGIPNSITAYVDWRLDNPRYRIANIPNFGPGVEVPFNYYIDNGQMVRGFIDRVMIDNVTGSLLVLDIKSGRKPKTDEQLGLYSAALDRGLGWEVEWGFYLYGLKSGTASVVGPIRLSHWTHDKLAAVYLPATRAIEQDIFLPNPGEACFHCGVSDSCAFVQALT